MIEIAITNRNGPMDVPGLIGEIIEMDNITAVTRKKMLK
jgi:hypothetical protein